MGYCARYYHISNSTILGIFPLSISNLPYLAELILLLYVRDEAPSNLCRDKQKQ